MELIFCRCSARRLSKRKAENERQNQEGFHTHKPERGTDLREILPWEARIRTAAARCARGRSREGPGCESPPGRRRRISRSERDRSAAPLHAAFDLELRHRPGHVSAGLLHNEIQSSRE